MQIVREILFRQPFATETKREKPSVTASPALPPLSPTEQAQRIKALAALLAEARHRHETWLRLFLEADVWTDPEKRRVMLYARWDYQHALLAYLSAFRASRNSLIAGIDGAPLERPATQI